jgi:hypothetical protein
MTRIAPAVFHRGAEDGDGAPVVLLSSLGRGAAGGAIRRSGGCTIPAISVCWQARRHFDWNNSNLCLE